MNKTYLIKTSTAQDVQDALDNGSLLKPYVAYVSGSSSVDFNTKSITPVTPTINYNQEPLTIKANSNVSFTLGISGLTLEYSINDGTWTNGSNGDLISLNNNQTVKFRAYETGSAQINIKILNATGSFETYGRLASLMYNTEDITFSDSTWYASNGLYNWGMDWYYPGAFMSMFENATGLTDASHLILEDLFQDSLADCPEHTYAYMFKGCTSLVGAPKIGGDVIVEDSMVVGKDEYCYAGMFSGCSSLSSVTCSIETLSVSYENPEWIPEEDWEDGDEDGEPENPNEGEQYTTEDAYNSFEDWLVGTAATGVFHKHPSNTEWAASGTIPQGWTISDIVFNS